MIRLGIIGVGFGRTVLAPAFRRAGGFSVDAICASRLRRAQEAAANLGIPRACRSWRELIDDPELDAIAVALPPVLQSTVVMAALASPRPKHVFCEKPAALKAIDARRMLEAARRAGVAHMVDFEFLEIPQWARAARILRGGGLGRLRNVFVSWHIETYAQRMGIRSWKTRAADGGGALNIFVPHIFYYLESLVGRISALSARVERGPAARADAGVLLQLGFAGGAIGAASVTTNSPGGSGHRLEIYGERGGLILENPTADHAGGFRLWRTDRTHGMRQVRLPISARSRLDDGRILAVVPLARRFRDWIHGKRRAAPSLVEGYRVQHLIEASLRSHRTRGWVAVPR